MNEKHSIYDCACVLLLDYLNIMDRFNQAFKATLAMLARSSISSMLNGVIKYDILFHFLVNKYRKLVNYSICSFKIKQRKPKSDKN